MGCCVLPDPGVSRFAGTATPRPLGIGQRPAEESTAALVSDPHHERTTNAPAPAARSFMHFQRPIGLRYHEPPRNSLSEPKQGPESVRGLYRGTGC
jgi:hypothetical protein